LAQLGRRAEAAAAAEKLREEHPNFSPTEVLDTFPLVHPPARELFLDGARKAQLIS
jgi:hypothetical protein